MWSSHCLPVNPVCQVQAWASVISSAFCYAPSPKPAFRTLHTGTYSIYLPQGFGLHLGGGKQLPAFQLAHLEQGGRGTHVDTAEGCSPIAVSCGEGQHQAWGAPGVIQEPPREMESDRAGLLQGPLQQPSNRVKGMEKLSPKAVLHQLPFNSRRLCGEVDGVSPDSQHWGPFPAKTFSHS